MGGPYWAALFSLRFLESCGKGAAMTLLPTYVPPEWAPHAAVWVGWPHLRGEWGDAFDGARAQIAGFVRAVSKVTPVRIACGSREAYTSAWMALDDVIAAGNLTLHTVMTGDIWLRDTGPILVCRSGKPEALRFQFNGWGGKFELPGDTMTAHAIASVERVHVHAVPFVLEGGAIDLDGDGRLLTTRQCVLNDNRNADWTQSLAETKLRDAFGVDQIIWLGDGLLNDHTDGHVDNIARFVGPGRVVCQSPSGEDDPNRAELIAIQNILSDAGLNVCTIPSPGLIIGTGGAAPASHMNFLISNKTIFMPTFETRYSPGAVAALEQIMPGFQVIALPADSILAGGGAFHCMTQQVPELEELSR